MEHFLNLSFFREVVWGCIKYSGLSSWTCLAADRLVSVSLKGKNWDSETSPLAKASLEW